MRILFVDDAPIDIELAQIELQSAGLEFESWSEETEAGFLQALATFHPDIIICDYVMPRFDGLRALALLRTHAPLVPFIMLTGAIDETTAVACMKAGAADYITKEHLAQLPFAVREALARSAAQATDEKEYRLWKAGEERFRSVCRNVGMAILLVDPESLAIADATLMACDFFGRSLEAVIATSLGDLLQVPETQIREFLLARTPGEAFPLVYRAGNGSVRTIEIIVGGSCGSDGRGTSQQSGELLSCLVFDVTEKTATEARLRALAADMGHIDEHDRFKLATYLHDEVSHGLSSLRSLMDALVQAAPGSIPEGEYRQFHSILMQCMERTHSAVFTLSLPVLKNFGLSVTLEQEGEDFCARHGLGFRFHGQDLTREIPQEMAALLVRSVQHLLQNVADHADARQIWMRLFSVGTELRVEIRDDGRGFATPQRQGWSRSQGFGLFSTETRLASLGGRMEIVSTEGNTIVTLALPLP